MTGRELRENITYLGQERAARKLLLDNKLAKAEEVAVMTDIEVYDKLLQKYKVVMISTDDIVLVSEKDMDTLNKIAIHLKR